MHNIFILVVVLGIFLNSLSANNDFVQKSDSKFLNAKEQLWLNNLETPLTIGITQIPNQVLKSDKGYRGYSIDLFKEIANLLHISFRYVYYNSWGDLLQAAKNKKVDILFLAQKTEKRMHFFNFTDIVLIQHNKILTASKSYLQTDVTDLFNKRVSIVEGSAIADFIKMNYPKIEIVKSKNEQDSLQKLLKKEVAYTIVEPVRASYYIKQNNINNLYITGDFPYDYKLRIASRNDLAILNIILNKTIEAISPADKKALALKWGYEKEHFFSKQIIINIVIFLLLIIGFLFYLSILNRKLQKTKKRLHQNNITLELRVSEEVEKNRRKDLIMLNHSRFAQMGQVINMIAHQWRQPLNNLSLIIQAYFFKAKKGEVDYEKLEEFKNKTMLQIKQMSKTIDDFRDFFKEEKEKILFNFPEITTTLLHLVKPVLDKSNIELIVEQEDNILIKGYANELTQAIINIIYNAKDVLVEKNIEKKIIKIVLKKEGSKAILTIQDNAGGIAEDIKNKIFDPYFSTKGKNGTGIGLYMVKIIIEEHMNGKVTVSNEKEGAKFLIELPLADSSIYPQHT